jgi:predicted acetyltransferase
MELISTRHLFQKKYGVAKSRRNLILRLLLKAIISHNFHGVEIRTKNSNKQTDTFIFKKRGKFKSTNLDPMKNIGRF